MFISLFDDVYEYFISIGKSKIEAKHRAIDEYRKHIKNRVSFEDWIIEQDGIGPQTGQEADPEWITSLNQRVKLIVLQLEKLSNKKHKQFLFLSLRRWGVDEYFDEELNRVCWETIGDCYPSSRQDIATAMGLSKGTNGYSKSLVRYETTLYQIAEQFC